MKETTYWHQDAEYAVWDAKEEPRYLRLILKPIYESAGQNYLIISEKKAKKWRRSHEIRTQQGKGR